MNEGRQMKQLFVFSPDSSENPCCPPQRATRLQQIAGTNAY